MPNRPGTGRGSLRPVHVDANSSSPQLPIDSHRAAPCTNCYITDIVPNLIYDGDANNATGTTANLNNGAMMHHFVLINPAQHGRGLPERAPGTARRALLRRRQRAHAHAPAEPRTATRTRHARPGSLITHLVNKSRRRRRSSASRSIYRYRDRPAARDRGEAAVARHRRLRRLGVHDPDRLLATRTCSLDFDRQRAHDRDLRPPARRRHHRPDPVRHPLRRRRAAASRVSAELVGGARTTTSGRSRRTTRRRPTSRARRFAARRATTARRSAAPSGRAISTR